jgi:D-glycero-alpha-D-manno-heptose 1-phosphate guanylyltransferase
VITAIILAGGLGTRLRSAVPDVPKPMAPLNSRPFLEHQMDFWIGQGVRHFILSVGYRHEIISNHFGNHYRGAEICYSVEAEPLGTGGGLLLAASKIKASGPRLVLNGDTLFDVRLESLLAFHETKKSDFTLTLFPVDNNPRYTGVEINVDHQITALRSPAPGGNQLINGGVYLMADTVLQSLPFKPGEKCSFENDILEYSINAGLKVFGHVSTGKFIDIGVPEDYSRAAVMLR